MFYDIKLAEQRKAGKRRFRAARIPLPEVIMDFALAYFYHRLRPANVARVGLAVEDLGLVSVAVVDCMP